MIEYKCGHTTDGMIVLDDNELSMTMYLEWAEEENNLKTQEECFDCYLKRLDKERMLKELDK